MTKRGRVIVKEIGKEAIVVETDLTFENFESLCSSNKSPVRDIMYSFPTQEFEDENICCFQNSGMRFVNDVENIAVTCNRGKNINYVLQGTIIFANISDDKNIGSADISNSGLTDHQIDIIKRKLDTGVVTIDRIDEFLRTKKISMPLIDRDI